jgi:hypothetical protein
MEHDGELLHQTISEAKVEQEDSCLDTVKTQCANEKMDMIGTVGRFSQPEHHQCFFLSWSRASHHSMYLHHPAMIKNRRSRIDGLKS